MRVRSSWNVTFRCEIAETRVATLFHWDTTRRIQPTHIHKLICAQWLNARDMAEPGRLPREPGISCIKGSAGGSLL